MQGIHHVPAIDGDPVKKLSFYTPSISMDHRLFVSIAITTPIGTILLTPGDDNDLLQL
jgi:hypothetical protein